MGNVIRLCGVLLSVGCYAVNGEGGKGERRSCLDRVLRRLLLVRNCVVAWMSSLFGSHRSTLLWIVGKQVFVVQLFFAADVSVGVVLLHEELCDAIPA